MNDDKPPTFHDASVSCSRALHECVRYLEWLRTSEAAVCELTDETRDMLIATHDDFADRLVAAITSLEGATFAEYVRNRARLNAIKVVHAMGRGGTHEFDTRG